MSQYECPNCDGGFPELPPDKECPWCGQSMDKSYSTTPGFEPYIGTSNSVTRPEIGNPLRENELLDEKDGVRIPPTSNGTTPCPDCGEPMGMVTWTGQKPKCDDCQRGDRNSLTGDIT